MRRICTLQQLGRAGVTRVEREERWRRIAQGVYGEGRAVPTAMDRAIAVVVATGGTASGQVAGALFGYDGIDVRRPHVTVPLGSSCRRQGVHRRDLRPHEIMIVEGIACTSPLRTLCDLAAELDELRWEQVLESALRREHVTFSEVEQAARSVRNAARIRRVLARRGDVPATGSLLETLMVQLARRVKGLPAPRRQVPILNRLGEPFAKVDLAWPALGVFIELDGQHHKGQPVYDAVRQNAVSSVTGWLCGRFTWHQVVYLPQTTARQLADLIRQAGARSPYALRP